MICVTSPHERSREGRLRSCAPLDRSKYTSAAVFCSLREAHSALRSKGHYEKRTNRVPFFSFHLKGNSDFFFPVCVPKKKRKEKKGHPIGGMQGGGAPRELAGARSVEGDRHYDARGACSFFFIKISAKDFRHSFEISAKDFRHSFEISAKDFRNSQKNSYRIVGDRHYLLDWHCSFIWLCLD
jgi:hypothetical protein